MSTGAPTRLALLLVGLGVALGVGLVSVRRVGDQLAALEACEAARGGDWATVLARSEGRLGPDETGRSAAECRCTALLATGAGAACVELLEQLLAQPEADGWAPAPPLAIHLIQTWREAGRGLEAAELARRTARLHPENPDLFYLELLTRSVGEDEARLLEELAARVAPRGPAAVRMRVSLANRHLLRGDPAAARAALGDAPPPEAGEALGLWFEMRGMASAAAGDLAGVEATYARWREAGGDPAELLARFALTLSIGGLQSPRQPTEALLRRALAGELDDAALEEALTIRLVLTLVNEGQLDEALALYDRGRQRFAMEGLSRQEIQRSAAHRRLAAAPPEARRGVLRFVVPGPVAGGVLLVSPQPDAPLDAPYQVLPLPPSGRLDVERRLGTAPQRWVLRDGAGDTLASGTASPLPGATLPLTIAPGAPQPSQHSAPSRRPRDGRRRVALLLLDCADWRIVQYLRARGELPVLSALLERGYRAVLYSDPPLTAAALEALVWPQRRGLTSFVGLAHRFGVELAGLASVGENPFEALAWILPETPDLFSVIGAGRFSAANLLFAHGGIQAGRHSVVTGPQGRRRRIPLATSARDLDAVERRRFPALAALRRERDAIHLRTIAAEFDSAEALVREAEVDLLALRIEPLDILTHAHFAAAVRDGQDDGQGLLFSIYRYIDARLGAVQDLLDEDDLFIVMSDHGIRTAMEHSRFALFVAAGEGAPQGRAAGVPDLRGIPRVLAELFGATTDWPATGVAPWAHAVASAPSLAQGVAKLHPAPSSR
jgi:hypothetical protein